MSTIRLQVKLPNNNNKVITLSSTTRLYDLQLQILQLSNISIQQQLLLSGYPPKHVTDNNKNVLLHDIGIKNNDAIIVKVKQQDNLSNDNSIGNITPSSTANRQDVVPQPDSNTVIKPQHNTTNNNNATVLPLQSQPQLSLLQQQSLNNDLVPLKRIVIPDDNSCLFNAISYAINDTINQPHMLRTVVANEIVNNKHKYDIVYLENKTHRQYADYIKQNTVWGGQIELQILAEHYKIQIIAVDIEHIVHYTYGNEQYKQCIYVIYSGIHYDTLVDDLGLNDHNIEIRQFDSYDKLTLQRALLTAKQLNQKHEYTNIMKFTIRCVICKQGFKGAEEAQNHAQSTRHTQFEEYV